MILRENTWRFYFSIILFYLCIFRFPVPVLKLSFFLFYIYGDALKLGQYLKTEVWFFLNHRWISTHFRSCQVFFPLPLKHYQSWLYLTLVWSLTFRYVFVTCTRLLSHSETLTRVGIPFQHFKSFVWLSLFIECFRSQPQYISAPLERFSFFLWGGRKRKQANKSVLLYNWQFSS